MENHDLSTVSEHQFSLDSFAADADHHVGKFDSTGTTALIGNVTVSVADSVIDTTGLVATFSNAQPIVADSALTTSTTSGGIGHVTLSDISSNLRRISAPGSLLTGTIISPESLRAVSSIFQAIPDSLTQQRSLSSSSSVSNAVTDSIPTDMQQDGHPQNLSVGLNIVAGSLGALSEKEVGRSGSLSEQSTLGMSILQVGDNPLSAITSSCNVVFTTGANTTSLISSAALEPGGDGEPIDIGGTLPTEETTPVPSSSLLESEPEMMVGSVGGVEPAETRPIPVTCRLTSQELARLVHTVENVGGDVGELGGGSEAVSLVHVGGVPSVEFSSTGEVTIGQLVIRQGSVVYTQDGEEMVAMTTHDDEVDRDGAIAVNIAPPRPVDQGGTSKVASPPATEKKKAKGGWPKGKKRKKDLIEMANAPKPPSTAYVIFLSEQRPKVRAAHPDLAGPRVSSFLGKMWSGLPLLVKKRYLDLEKSDRGRYMKEIKEYQESSSCQALLQKQAKDSIGHFAGSEEEMAEHINRMNKNDVLGCNHLHCKVCNMYFTSNHNMEQHILGKHHMTVLATKICEMDQETLGLRDLDDSTQDASTSTDCLSCACFRDGMPDTEGFRSAFMNLHYERELELRELRRQHAISIHEQLTLRRKFKELQDTLSKMESDHRNLKAIGTNLQSQLDGVYRMILFLT